MDDDPASMLTIQENRHTRILFLKVGWQQRKTYSCSNGNDIGVQMNDSIDRYYRLP